VRSFRVFKASAALELAQLRGNRAFVVLTALAAVSFLAMVNLFGLTRAYAPVALIDRDGGPYARRLAEALLGAHHSFALKSMSPDEARTALYSGRLVGIITIPPGFSSDIENGTTVALDVPLDKVRDHLRSFRATSSAPTSGTAPPWRSTSASTTSTSISPTTCKGPFRRPSSPSEGATSFPASACRWSSTT
jgi:hypothetical protein